MYKRFSNEYDGCGLKNRFILVDMASQGNEENPLTPETLMSTMKEMMRMITQHREELSKHSEGPQNNISSPPSQPEASSKIMGETAI